MLALVLAAAPALPASLAAQDDLVRRPVPEVVGLAYAEARVRILRARVGPVEVVDTVVAGVDSATVVRQDPAGGVQAVVPTTVTLWVSRPARADLSGIRSFLMDVSPTAGVTGQVPTADTMPNLRGRPLREGLKLLEVLGLEAVTESVASREPPGTIVRHLPAPGERVEPGGLVRLWVADAAAGRTVPRVVGMPVEKAFEAFAAEGIQVARVDTVAVDPDRSSRPPGDGTVVRQAPAPGEPLEPGALGRLLVAVWDTSVEPAQGVVLPDVVGRPLEEAIGALEEAGARVGQVVSVVSPAPARSVVEQKPPGGAEVAPGADVALAVSEGPRVTVPDLVGAPLERAEQALEATGLVLDGVTRVPSGEPDGTVVAQSPEPGRTVPSGAPVDLTVAAPLAEPETVPVPEVVGRALEEAERLLDATGLRVGSVELVTADAATGTVVAQFPPAGTRLAPDAAVRLDVATGVRAEPAPVPVPEVVGMDRGAALDSLSSAGLRRVDTRGSGTEVVDQFPSPGALVAPGTPVLLTLQAQAPEGAPGTLPGWLRRWEAWGLPVGIALLWGLLRLRRVAGRGGTEEAADPDDETQEAEPEEDPEPSGPVEYRLMRASPRGEVEVTGPLLPELALSLRPRPPRSLGAILELPPDGRLSPGPDPDPAPPRSDAP